MTAVAPTTRSTPELQQPASSGSLVGASTIHWAIPLVIVALIGLSYSGTLWALGQRWANEADYSHGFFVPVFSAYLLWHRRALWNPSAGGRWLGAVLLFGGCALRLAGLYFNYQLVEPVSLLPCLAGAAMLLGGWNGLRYAWPSVAFLVFMIPLPGFVAGQLSGPLQRVATIASTFTLQTISIPAVATGNVIWLTNGQIGVVEACNGLRMLMTFFALTVGASFLIKATIWEKLLVIGSALGIALLANIIRIAVTGMVFEWGDPKIAERVFHDLAGWLMMPFAMLLLLGELHLLSRLLVPAVDGPVVQTAAPHAS